jgi:hypothetical protein
MKKLQVLALLLAMLLITVSFGNPTSEPSDNNR